MLICTESILCPIVFVRIPPACKEWSRREEINWSSFRTLFKNPTQGVQQFGWILTKMGHFVFSILAALCALASAQFVPPVRDFDAYLLSRWTLKCVVSDTFWQSLEVLSEYTELYLCFFTVYRRLSGKYVSTEWPNVSNISL